MPAPPSSPRAAFFNTSLFPSVVGTASASAHGPAVCDWDWFGGLLRLGGGRQTLHDDGAAYSTDVFADFQNLTVSASSQVTLDLSFAPAAVPEPSPALTFAVAAWGSAG